jgi:hypothetical protein
MVAYDEAVIVRMAERLYAEAGRVVVTYAFLGAVCLGLGGMAFGGEMAVVGGLLGLAFGAAIGNARAEALRLQAQQALCQVQIERNTRRAAD